jgi:hypothetical protein
VPKAEITAVKLRAMLDYDPAIGVFVRKVATSNRTKAGEIAGIVNSIGYISVWLDGQPFLGHRLAWLYVHGEWPKNAVDHINAVRHDNRIANLRDVTQTINIQNRRKPQSNSTTGYLGVSWYAGKKRFCARIKTNGKYQNLGYFHTAEAAYAVYLSAKRELHAGCTI